MFIDIHVHTTSMPSINIPGSEQTLATPEQLIEMYDTVGIERGVLLPNANPEGIWCVQSNEEILAIVERYPDRFIPFCNIDPRLWTNNPDEDLSYYIGWYRDHGCRGIGEVCCNLYWDDPRVENLFKHAEALDMPICFHVATREGRTYGLIDDFGLPRFEEAIRKFPDLVWLCHSQAWWSHISGDVNMDNWGTYPKGPVTTGGRVVELMRKYPTVIGDLSAGSGFNAVSRDPQFGYWFLDQFQDQLCFGTDICSPRGRENVLINLANFMKQALAEGNISQEVFDKIAHRNARRILKL
jgi:uncharacterized protein